MRDLNRMMILGRVGSQPERRETKNGVPVVNFSVATSRKSASVAVAAASGVPAEAASTGESGSVEVPPGTEGIAVPPTPPSVETEITQWHRVVVWGKQAEHCARFLKKGETVFVDGSLRSRTYKDGAGIERTIFEAHADAVLFLGRRQRTHAPISSEDGAAMGAAVAAAAEVLAAADAA